MNEFNQTFAKSRDSVLATNKVLKNTYVLLSGTLILTAVMAYVGVAIGLGTIGYIVSIVAALLILFFVMPRYEESTGIGGLVCVFLFTGLFGLALGPILSMALQFSNGAKLIGLAFGGTGIIFLALSGYALTTKKDFSFMGGFLIAGLMIAIIASFANIFLGIAGLSLAISVVVILIFSGLILYDTSAIIRGEETNYIRATVGLYLNIYNIFVHLLHLLLAFAGDS